MVHRCYEQYVSDVTLDDMNEVCIYLGRVFPPDFVSIVIMAVIVTFKVGEFTRSYSVLAAAVHSVKREKTERKKELGAAAAAKD